ncbi:hypothetical protein EDC04DRAFT_2603380 [Pisolithus marmoratus]|nr:hypothetical protein EDC04DRAFT_2603380 [Pisolithus marmoratus]
MQCYWFVATVFAALKSLFAGAKQDTTTHQGGRWNGLLICMKESLDEVCAKYCAAWAALLEEIELKCRVEHQQEDERQWECEQCQAVEEAAKWECKKCQAVEDKKQRECKKCQIAEDAAKVAEERAQVAEEANAKLLQDLEALQRAGATRHCPSELLQYHNICHKPIFRNTVFTEPFYQKEVMSGGGLDFEEHEKPPDSASVDEPLECPIKDKCDMFFKLLRGPASEPAKKLLASMDLDRELQALWRYL